MRPVDSRMAGRAFFGMIAHYAMTGLSVRMRPFKQIAKRSGRVRWSEFSYKACAKRTANESALFC